VYDENPGIFPSSTPMNALHHASASSPVLVGSHTKGDKTLLNFNVDHNRFSTTVIGFQIRDIMTIRYMCGPSERMERYVYIQKNYRIHTRDNSPKGMMKSAQKRVIP